MLFALATLKKIGKWHLVQQRIKRCSKNAFFTQEWRGVSR